MPLFFVLSSGLGMTILVDMIEAWVVGLVIMMTGRGDTLVAHLVAIQVAAPVIMAPIIHLNLCAHLTYSLLESVVCLNVFPS